jgi:ubiquinone/menaquinone biosynthesis C-methylase UbiE
LKPLLDHFGLLAPVYEFFIRPKDPEKLWSLADIPSNGIVLDAGGGTGRVSQYLHGKAAQIVVADESFGMLREPQKKVGLQPVRSLTEVLPFRKETFDCIIMVDALHHVADQVKTTEELWRVLKAGGRIIIQEPNIQSFGVRLIAITEKLFLMRSHFSPPQKITEMFRSHNAKVKVEVDGSTSWIVVDKV